MSHRSPNIGRCGLMLYNDEKTQFIRKIFARVPCPSLSFDVYSNSCPLSWWCHPNSSSSTAPFSPCPQSFPASGSFPMNRLFTSGGHSIGVSASPNEYLGLISFRIDWFNLLAVQGTLKSLLQHHSLKASIIWCLAFFMDDFYIFVLWKHRSEWPLSGLALMTSYLLSSFFFQNPKPSSFLAESSLVCQWVDRKTFSSQ